MPITSPEARKRRSEHKLGELMLYIAAKSEGDSHFGSVKLNKLLYFADFTAYRRLGRPITGMVYARSEHGPTPCGLLGVQAGLERRRRAVVTRHLRYGSHQQKRLVALADPNLRAFSADEIAIVDGILEEARALNTEQMSELSHAHHGWKLAAPDEEIPYFTALLQPGPTRLTDSEREWALGVVARLVGKAA